MLSGGTGRVNAMVDLPNPARGVTLAAMSSDPTSATDRPITTPAHVLGAAGVLSLLTVLMVARGMWAVALQQLVRDGIVAGCWLLSATGFGAAALRAARIEFQTTAWRLVCAVATGLGCVSLMVLGLGLCGALNRAAAVAIIGVGAGLLVWDLRTKPIRARTQATRWSWLWLLAVPALGTASICALVPPGVLWGDEPHGYDVVEYHLQVPREWYESGRIAPLTHNVYSYFPFNVEMHYLLGMHLTAGPWAAMYLAQLMHLSLVALSIIAVYGVLREQGSKYATLGALAAASAPWVMLLAPIGYNEGGLLLFGALAIGLFMTARQSTTPLRHAALAGAMAGFACGTKLTAVPMVLLAVPLASLVFGVRQNLGRAAVFLAIGTVVFSPWLIRTLVWTGNPVFPEAAQVLGRGHFSDVQVERWARAHAPRDDQRTLSARLGAWRQQVWLDWRYGFLLLPLALAIALLSLDRSDTRYLLVLLLILSAIWLFLSHLQGRFFVLAIPVAALLIGQVRQAAAAAASAVLVAGMTILGLVVVHLRFESRPLARELIGFEQLRVFTPLAQEDLSPDDRVILIGDARAFLYDVPMNRLSYRTVFDVDARQGESSVDAWMRGATIVPGATIFIIDPAEVRRFAATYWKIPAPPDEVAGRVEPYVVRK